MFMFLVFLGVAVVWVVVLALLAWRLWRQGKGLVLEVDAAQRKLEAAQREAARREAGKPSEPDANVANADDVDEDLDAERAAGVRA